MLKEIYVYAETGRVSGEAQRCRAEYPTVKINDFKGVPVTHWSKTL
jgi:hypothetical protein